ncbi:DUF6894 family protein [Stappia stellulata]|uniref:DUF6894 family protein n=1 Tax=Stappia stellulata TaxID=71235 RepID=UPI000401C97C|nr:hypothetical protein [Stappia stellulata]
MTLFYFDVNNGVDTPDDTGTHLADRATARAEALAVLAPIVAELMPDDVRCSVSVTVRDEEKRPIFHASLALVEDWIG